jgi:cytochrome c biogenesis protein CcmG/thiol:disulfide interchange protein DsbE
MILVRPRLLSMALLAISVAFGLAWLAAYTAGADDSIDVKLETLNWDAFKARLAQAKAANYKYTIVDAWSTTCGPCKENFPHLVEMNQKYGKKGLQVISLSLDDTTDAKAVEAARKFLAEKKATFLNVLLDEELGVGFEKLNINAIPAVFLYGPDGKEIQRFTMDDVNNQFTYQQVEEKVAALLGEKTAAKQ